VLVGEVTIDSRSRTNSVTSSDFPTNTPLPTFLNWAFVEMG
jgi:hypothetical protein